MVIEDPAIISQEEVESTLQPHQQPKIQTSKSIGQQSSIYSLTLDEFQQNLSEKGRNFGSMNMDEFLNSIWTAEENQATNTQATIATANGNNINGKQNLLQESNASMAKGIPKQSNLSRQGSLSIPEPLCQKTVDEVWSDIHKDQRQHINDTHVQNPRSTQRQRTFGEMTLEDFLVKAGVVREQNHPQVQPQHQQYGMYPNRDYAVPSNFVAPPGMGMGGGNIGGNANDANVATYHALPQSGVGDPPGYPGGMKKGVRYAHQPLIVYGGRTGNSSAGGYEQVQGLEMGSPISPLSSDRLCTNQVENSNHHGSNTSGNKGGRKRNADGQVERVVERRQRRMIKNRESAARSRARKQAYTVELEAELKQLKEENEHLQQALAKLERKRKQQNFEEARMKVQAQTKAQKTNEKLRVMRRCLSCSY
ncbi:protein ABSCISIC ACID-INSENSITIVE 5-like [Olea europaea var. sylvestris]|uniref:protein ABSCISIC ACID-INSENSITIVE 5-like n=1 Tax=Olea europaea var. sylvestris TaxID=158386 RepID=UPI000C1CFF29|nr:protein ABSCISIC ACID-INSENSITIVE 5-like [Olea europaea var. sylvestris]